MLRHVDIPTDETNGCFSPHLFEQIKDETW